MEIWGKSMSQGIAIGRIFLYENKELTVALEKIEDLEKELVCFQKSKEEVKAAIHKMYQETLEQVGAEEAAIFAGHETLLEDPEYEAYIVECMKSQQVSSAYAVKSATDYFSDLFAQTEDIYMMERARDVVDVGKQLICAITQKKDEEKQFAFPAVLVAEDLTPSDTVRMDKNSVVGFVTLNGSKNSHTAILTRALQKPALSGISSMSDWHGKQVIVDGYAGKMIIDPGQDELVFYQKLQMEKEAEESRFQLLRGKETRTAGGRKISLYGNVGSIQDVDTLLANDGEGIGLLRSEFLYMESVDYPSEEQQFEAYRCIAQKMQGRKVIIRTLDLGTDKKTDYMELPDEMNPAMGFRGIRFCLKHKELFQTQLRAILRASAYGDISIMYPMIISGEEVREAKKILEETRQELLAKNIVIGEVSQGIMIETPAAVWISDELAKEVDFFSIGTNDLTQFMLAMDRQNQQLDMYYPGIHKAVLQAIELTIKNAHENGILVGICGELGSDVTALKNLIALGIDEISVQPGNILKLREAIMEME